MAHMHLDVMCSGLSHLLCTISNYFQSILCLLSPLGVCKWKGHFFSNGTVLLSGAHEDWVFKMIVDCLDKSQRNIMAVSNYFYIFA